ncbi:HNH endonuclease [Lysinibacillus sp. fkY74-1]
MSKDKLYDRYKRDPQATSFYRSYEWQKMRDYVFKRDLGLCQPCLELGTYTTGDVVHHIVELRDGEEGWSKRLDEDNLETVCHSCHNNIHKGDGTTRGAVPNGCMFDENGQLIKKQ